MERRIAAFGWSLALIALAGLGTSNASSIAQDEPAAAEADSESSEASVSAIRPEIAVPDPMRIPDPGTETDEPYAPRSILPGGVVIPLYPPDSPHLKPERIREPEKYQVSESVPGRINSIVNIHNPSIEVHPVPGNLNTGSVVILAAGGGHRTLNVGTESADFVPFFYNYGVNTVILRNRLRSDGYTAETDAVHDALQAIRLVRKLADRWRFDPNRIGIMGFSAGAEPAAPAAVFYEKFDAENTSADDPLAGVTSRPDFVGVIYPGPTPFTRDAETPIRAARRHRSSRVLGPVIASTRSGRPTILPRCFARGSRTSRCISTETATTPVITARPAG